MSPATTIALRARPKKRAARVRKPRPTITFDHEVLREGFAGFGARWRVTIHGLALPSWNNERLHWRAADARKRFEKEITELALRPFGRAPAPLLDVTITRRSRGRLDSDNLPSCAKYVRDTIAKWIGVDDRHDRLVAYVVKQESAKTPSVLIEIARRV